MFGDWFPREEGEAGVEVRSEPATRDSGGTGHLLPRERAKASFSVDQLTAVLDGSEKKTARRRWIWSQGEMFNNAQNMFLPREELVSQHLERFIAIHQKYLDSFIPNAEDICMMGVVTKNGGALSLHYGAFLPTILSQGSDEQKMEWLFPAFQMKIVGCLAQTELGHGSNVRALQTTAEYLPDSQQFELNSPTLLALKWWPGGLGKTATHAVVYAQLIINGKHHGLHSFIVQLRDDKHRPLPGVELGEVGPKIGDNFTETGFMRLTHVRIPREWMLSKNQTVSPEGVYQKLAKGEGAAKSQYSTMLSIRTALVIGAGYKLAQGVCVVARYSCVRHQGFQDSTNAGASHESSERPIIDYQVQAFRILKQLALAYAFVFTGKVIQAKFDTIKAQMDAAPEDADWSALPEMHASSSGLKALCTFSTADGLEECRKCCGGHGVLLASGVAQLAVDYVTYCTAEGDRIILELQCARYLMKAYRQAVEEKSVVSGCEYLRPLAASSFSLSSLAPLSLSSPRDANNLDILVELFERRALVKVVSVGQRLEDLNGQGVSDAWNECAMDLVQAARAHCYLIILRCFVTRVQQIEVPAVQEVMKRVCVCFALSHLVECAGDWFGHLTSLSLQHTQEALREVMRALRPDLIALVDAFEFPDNVLNSALGKYDGKVYEALYESAKASPLNKEDPLAGYKFLEPLLDKEFLRDHATMQSVASHSAKL